MTLTPSPTTLVRAFGLLLGVVLAAAALAAWRVPGGERTLGADIRVSVAQSGAVGVSPLHPFVSAPSLVPGTRASGSGTLRNQTGVPLTVRLRAPASDRRLGRVLRVHIDAGADRVYDGTLEDLSFFGTRPLRMAPSQERKLSVRVSLPSGVSAGFQGRIDDIALQIHSERAK
jgi:hypothetical protein